MFHIQELHYFYSVDSNAKLDISGVTVALSYVFS